MTTVVTVVTMTAAIMTAVTVILQLQIQELNIHLWRLLYD